MGRILLNFYDDLIEFCLWAILIGAILAGYRFYGLSGALAGAVIAFISLVLGVVPFLQLSDIRKRLISIEAATAHNSDRGYISGSVSKVREPVVTSYGREAGERIKVYKGYKIKKEANGVSVEGRQLAGILKAEEYIDSLF
jgi:hypothetical protein